MPLFDTASIPEQVERLEQVLLHLKRIRDSTGPNEAELSSAPVLDNWSLGTRPQYALLGTASGHPGIADGHVLTSPLVYLDPNRCWARTWGRYYILGRPRERPGQQDQ